MQSLVDLEDPDAPDLFRSFAEGEDAEMAVFAGLMLARARCDGAEVVLRSLAMKFSGNAMRAAILALASLRTEASMDSLKQLARNDRAAVRDAVMALDEMRSS